LEGTDLEANPEGKEAVVKQQAILNGEAAVQIIGTAED
jgi:hypothetical protein